MFAFRGGDLFTQTGELESRGLEPLDEIDVRLAVLGGLAHDSTPCSSPPGTHSHRVGTWGSTRPGSWNVMKATSSRPLRALSLPRQARTGAVRRKCCVSAAFLRVGNPSSTCGV